MAFDISIVFPAAFFIAAFSSLFTIINPFSTASVFLTITRGDSKAKKMLMARKASITAAIVLIIFALAGSFILDFFSITVDAFRIAGGLIIGGIGFKMINAKREHLGSEEEKKEARVKDDISIIPLAIPMMSGPGAMTTSLILMRETSGIVDAATLIFAIIVVLILSYFIVSRADILDRYLGETGRHVSDRVMGLIVLVVGVQFIINGVGGMLTGWGLVSVSI